MAIGNKILRRHLTAMERPDRAEGKAFRSPALGLLAAPGDQARAAVTHFRNLVVLPDMTDPNDGALLIAVYGLRKALAQGNSGGLSLGRRDAHDEDDERAGRLRSRNDSLLVTAWDSASGALVPLAETAAEAAGKWVARNSPDLVRERLMPRFIESFTDAA